MPPAPPRDRGLGWELGQRLGQLPGEICRRAIQARLPLPHHASARSALDLLRPELDEYAEIISAPPGPLGGVAGFMTRGEGPAFTERARTIAIAAGGGDNISSVGELMALAAWCEHRRAFFKVEWHPRGEACDVVMASYFRRRPPLSAVQRHLLDQGVPVEALEQLEEVARRLGKRTPHFVSMALRPGHSSHYKIYFSQYVTAETAAEVRRNVHAALETMQIHPAALARWEAQHASSLSTSLASSAALPVSDATLFLSVSLTTDGVVPGIKIDYPDVLPEAVAAWSEPSDASDASATGPAIAAAARAAAAEVGAPALSYLGVRFLPHAPAPILKFYADRYATPRLREMRAS